MQPIQERALRNITSDVVNAAPASRQAFYPSGDLMKVNECTVSSEAQMDGVDPLSSSMNAQQMRDHVADNSCSCMEENKDGNI